MNFFEFYDLPFSLQIDEELLKRLFYEKSRQYHPDFHTLQDADVQSHMMEQSAINNKAYHTLKSFGTRLEYVLRLKHILKDEGENVLPQEFLMDMMELNESVMELEFEPNPTLREGLQSDIVKLHDEHKAKIQPLITNPDLETLAEEDWKNLLDFHLKGKYLKRLEENLSAH